MQDMITRENLFAILSALRYAATGDQAMHSYPATRFTQIPPASD
jgi:hypothetical protein